MPFLNWDDQRLPKAKRLARPKAIFKKYDIRDLTTNAGQRGVSFSFDDVNRIKAIKNRAACLLEVDSLLDPKRHTARRNFFEKLKSGARTESAGILRLRLRHHEVPRRGQTVVFALLSPEITGSNSAKAAQRYERDKEQKDSNAKLSAEKKQVELLSRYARENRGNLSSGDARPRLEGSHANAVRGFAITANCAASFITQSTPLQRNRSC